MLATVPCRAMLYLGSILVALAVTACGGTAEPATGSGTPAGPPTSSAYLEAIPSIVSSLGQSLDVVEDQMAAIKTASLDSNFASVTSGGAGPEGLMQFFADGAAVLAQQATTLEGLEEQIAQISPPKDATQYHELLAEYVVMTKEAVREAERWFERIDVMCCVTMALGSWEQQSEKADLTKDEINAEAQRLGYPEVD